VTAVPTLEWLAFQRVRFEKDRGVTAVTTHGGFTYLEIGLAADRTPQQLRIYRALADREISINLIKLHPASLSLTVQEVAADCAVSALEALGFSVRAIPSVALVSVVAANMRHLPAVMGRIAAALLREQISIIQTGDAPDSVFCLVEAAKAEAAAAALRREFQIGPPPPRIVVQKFGGKSVGTPEARRLAAEKVRQARAEGLLPVVVVSAIGRSGAPYATDTLLLQLEAVDPATEPEARERDLLLACGEIISTVIMAQTLKAAGLKATALTGGQAGIVTDPSFGDAQILNIDPAAILHYFEQGVDAVVVAGFQGVTAPGAEGEHGAITTLGRGGSDTTASALGVALKAEKVEIYTHVDGVMTADPEVVPDARTLPLVTYEEVCKGAHQGTRVLHPRAAEIAMMHQIPLWVKSSFSDAPGTRVAALAEVVPPTRRGVSGVTSQSALAYHELTFPEPAAQAPAEAELFRRLGEAAVSCFLVSHTATTLAFATPAEAQPAVEQIGTAMGLPLAPVEACATVSAIAVDTWDTPGLIYDVVEALHDAGVRLVQITDSVGSVTCVVPSAETGRAVGALHRKFQLAG
jgi:aspartate kinase